MPFSGSNITFSVAFSVGNDFKSGQIQYTGTTDYVGTYGIALADVTETISFYQPGNHGGTPFATVTINRGVASTASANLPKDSSGKVIQGEYMVMVTAVVVGAVDPGTYTTPDSPALYHDFCPGTLTMNVEVDVDCLCAILSVRDLTAYATNGWTVSSSNVNIIGPITTGTTPVYTITSSGTSASTVGQVLYSNSYSWNVEVVITKGPTTLTLTKSGSVTPECATFCKMLCALKKATGMAEANHRLLPSLYMAGLQFTIMSNGQGCDNTAFQTASDSFWSYMAEFGITQDCDDCCNGCSEDDVIQPICSSGGGSTLSFVEGTPTWLTVNVVGNTVTIGLTAQAVAYLNAIATYNVSSSDGSVTILTMTVPGSSSAPQDITWDITATDRQQRMSFFYKEAYNFTGGVWLTTSNVYNVVRKGNIWLTPSANPTITYVNNNLRVSNLFNVPQNFKVLVSVVDYQISRQYQPVFAAPQLLVLPLAQNLPVNTTSMLFDIWLYDLGDNPLGAGLSKLKASDLKYYFDSITFQIIIEQ